MVGVFIEKRGSLQAQRPTDTQKEDRTEAGGTGHSPGTLRPRQLEKAGSMVPQRPWREHSPVMPVCSSHFLYFC